MKMHGSLVVVSPRDTKATTHHRSGTAPLRPTKHHVQQGCPYKRRYVQPSPGCYLSEMPQNFCFYTDGEQGMPSAVHGAAPLP